MRSGGVILRERRGRRAFTVVELLVAVAVIAVLGALLFPSLRAAIDSAGSAKCQQNLRTLWMAAQSYSTDNEQLIVQGYVAGAANPNNATTWTKKLAPYVNMTEKALRFGPLVQCPAAYAGFSTVPGYGGTPTGLTIGLSDVIGQGGVAVKITGFQQPSRIILFADQGTHPGGNNDFIGPWNTTFTGPDISFVHKSRSRMNAVFMDGHASSLSKDDARFLRGVVSYPWTETPLWWPTD